MAAGCDPGELGIESIIIRREATRAEVSQNAHDQAATRLGRLLYGFRRRYHTDQYALKGDRRRYRAMLGNDFDLVFAYRIGAAVWVDSIFGNEKPPRSVVDFDDIESLALARSSAGKISSRFWRMMVRRYIAELIRTEKRLVQDWTLTLVCSEHDAALLRQRGSYALPVPNAVQFPLVVPEPSGNGTRILFVGTLSYRPNVDGIIWFVNQVWPAVRALLGERTSLAIVGFDPHPEVLSLGGVAGVTVLGQIGDLAPVYAATNLVIVPIFSGSGTRTKILEAFSFQRAIVTTTLGCEGLMLEAGYHAAIADTAADFGQAIIALATASSKRQVLARNGHEYGLKNFSDQVVAASFERTIEGVMAPANNGTWSDGNKTRKFRRA